MSESPAPETDAAPAATAGELLRAARERQGLHLAVLAASLKVAQRKLELIESNRYDELPGATFVRSLALSMCRALKIDAEPVLARLPQPVVHGLDQVSLGLNAPFRDRGVRTDTPAWQRLLSLPLLAAALLVVASVVVYQLPPGAWSLGAKWLAPDATSTAATAASVKVEEAVPTVTDAPIPVVEGPGAAATLAPSLPPVQDSAPTTPTASAASAVAPSAPVPQPATAALVPANGPTATPSPASGLLSLRTAADSWVEVRDRNGQLLLSRKLAAGEAVGLDGAVPLRLTIGNVEATQVTFRGQPVALGASTRDNVARLELK